MPHLCRQVLGFGSPSPAQLPKRCTRDTLPMGEVLGVGSIPAPSRQHPAAALLLSPPPPAAGGMSHPQAARCHLPPSSPPWRGIRVGAGEEGDDGALRLPLPRPGSGAWPALLPGTGRFPACSSWDSSVPRHLIGELLLATAAAEEQECSPLFWRQPGFRRRRLQHLDFICGHLESMKDAGLLIPF